MVKKALNVFLLAGITISLSGCIALLAGAGGTAFWQAGKIVSEESASMTAGVKSTESAFKSERIELTDKVIKNKVTQIRGKDQSDKKVSVDIFDKGPKNIRIEIRYGFGEETPARDLLNAIKGRL